ncbi:hypothetical protein U14_00556 [Candidatus Moduliflexus flocculans]|uniref:Uncharacterized protein n=1 Tax=Candidatus Moduliflexus flocculans TaxID=1499966 RepID=A0A0S6VW29_9BACT|nr:hypothetical protein U14_00556 [Candidatus Moduliflexus flocculans]
MMPDISGKIRELARCSAACCWVYLLALTAAVSAQAQEVSLTIDGYATDYQWAHSSNRLAILIGANDANAWLYILDATLGEVTEKIALPTQEHIVTFGWLADDNGVLLATFNHDDGSGAFYRYRFSEKAFVNIYEHVERIYAQPTTITMDHGSSYWAATYVGEGHPDVAIYQDETMILATDVYPNTITAVRWKDHQLYCISGAYLEFGLTREQRSRHPEFSEEMQWGKDEAMVYALDPIAQHAQFVNISQVSLFNASPDNAYDLRIEQGEQRFTITFIRNSGE